MKTFVASRLSDGNNVFPCKIIIDDNGVTVRIPGIFNNEDRFINFDNISSVTVDAPLIGYSTIRFYTTGIGMINAHGFTKSEVREIKRLIDQGGDHEDSPFTEKKDDWVKEASDDLEEKKKEVWDVQNEYFENALREAKDRINSKSSVENKEYETDTNDVEETQVDEPDTNDDEETEVEEPKQKRNSKKAIKYFKSSEPDIEEELASESFDKVKDAKYDFLTKLFHRDKESMRKRDEESEKNIQELKAFFLKLFTYRGRKKALKRHDELLKITDDIDIYITEGKKEDALTALKKLDHPSTYRLPNSDTTYIDFWTNKRKAYIKKIMKIQIS